MGTTTRREDCACLLDPLILHVSAAPALGRFYGKDMIMISPLEFEFLSTTHYMNPYQLAKQQKHQLGTHKTTVNRGGGKSLEINKVAKVSK